MKLSTDEQPVAAINFTPTTQGKSSSSVLTSGAGMSSAPSSAASQHSQTPGLLKYIIWITPDAGWPPTPSTQSWLMRLQHPASSILQHVSITHPSYIAVLPSSSSGRSYWHSLYELVFGAHFSKIILSRSIHR